jgi:hypothetical protein
VQPIIRHLVAEILSDALVNRPDAIAQVVGVLRDAAMRRRYTLGLEVATELHLLANAIELERGTLGEPA